MNLDICLSACKEYVLAGVWNDTCVCGTGLSESETGADPFLPATTSQAQSVLREGIQEAGEGCNLPCPGNQAQFCGGGEADAVGKRGEGVRWSVYRNLNLTVLGGNTGEAESNRYMLAKETGNVSSNSRTTAVYQSAATRKTWLTSLFLAFDAAFLLFFP